MASYGWRKLKCRDGAVACDIAAYYNLGGNFIVRILPRCDGPPPLMYSFR